MKKIVFKKITVHVYREERTKSNFLNTQDTLLILVNLLHAPNSYQTKSRSHADDLENGHKNDNIT